jgi:DNA repair protein RadA/Sms
MGASGLRPIENPSELFLSQRPQGVPGSCVTVTLQGSRPLLLEVQALLASNEGGGNYRRTCVGVDPNRLAMLLAVLDRHGGAHVLGQDVFVNVAGGVRLFEPASDLAVSLAVASSHLRRPIPADIVALGEVGLTGELRHAARLETRLAEAARLGFKRAVVAPTPRGRDLVMPEGLRVDVAKTVAEAIEFALE